jgi:hypothetical protein
MDRFLFLLFKLGVHAAGRIAINNKDLARLEEVRLRAELGLKYVRGAYDSEDETSDA